MSDLRQAAQQGEPSEGSCMAVSRKFLVLNSSNLPMNKNFDGQVLEFIRDLPELGQVLLKQPHNGGTVALDYEHVQEQVQAERELYASATDRMKTALAQQGEPHIDWRDMYYAAKRVSEMWKEKYESIGGKVEYAVPQGEKK